MRILLKTMMLSGIYTRRGDTHISPSAYGVGWIASTRYSSPARVRFTFTVTTIFPVRF